MAEVMNQSGEFVLKQYYTARRWMDLARSIKSNPSLTIMAVADAVALARKDVREGRAILTMIRHIAAGRLPEEYDGDAQMWREYLEARGL